MICRFENIFKKMIHIKKSLLNLPKEYKENLHPIWIQCIVIWFSIFSFVADV